MNHRVNNQNRKFLRRIMLVGMVIFLCFGISGSPSVRAQQVNAPLEPGMISGTLRDSDGNLILGVSIEISAYSSPGFIVQATACSNSSTGQYVLTGISYDVPVLVFAGLLDCGKHLYAPEYYPDTYDFNSATPITLTSSSPAAAGIDFSLALSAGWLEYFFFNMNAPIMGESAVRRAVAFGTDRQRMLDEVVLPKGITGMVQNSYVPNRHWAVAPNPALSLYPYNPDQARTTLAAAGWIDSDQDGVREKNGQELVLSFKTTTMPMRLSLGAIFVSDMQAIGIRVNPEYFDPDTFFDINGPLATHNFDIAGYSTGYCHSAEDATCVPYPMFLTGHPDNDMSYSNPLADAEYAAAQAASTPEERLPHAIQHQVIVMQDLPLLPMFTTDPGSFISGSAGVAGARLSYHDGTNKTVISDGIGNYSLTVSPGWTGQVTPSKPSYMFTPGSMSYTNITTDQTSQNYTAAFIPTSYRIYLPLIIR